ncbi:unnamed protein product, partial [Polarella glacialis]
MMDLLGLDQLADLEAPSRGRQCYEHIEFFLPLHPAYNERVGEPLRLPGCRNVRQLVAAVAALEDVLTAELELLLASSLPPNLCEADAGDTTSEEIARAGQVNMCHLRLGQVIVQAGTAEVEVPLMHAEVSTAVKADSEENAGEGVLLIGVVPMTQSPTRGDVSGWVLVCPTTIKDEVLGMFSASGALRDDFR